jgi:glycosyltransferase involved in cell wall biosynthesis
MIHPFFSIIIPTYQSSMTLGTTLESVSMQSMRSFEVIIADGGSTDQTVAIAKACANRVPQLTISSESDQGVYDGINRVMPNVRGLWVLILGSDDRLAEPDILERAEIYLRNAREPLVHGDVLFDGTTSSRKHGELYDGAFDLCKLIQKNICQQAIFYKRSLFDDVGRFDIRYRVCADWDFNMKVAARHQILYIPLTISVFSASGMSSNTADSLFDAGRAAKLLRYLGIRLLSPSLTPARWELRKASVFAFEANRLIVGFLMYAVFLAHQAHTRIQKYWRHR